MAKNKYSIDFGIITEFLSPPNRLKPKFLAWLRVFVEPLKTVQNEFFFIFFPVQKTLSKRNGQKIILEKTLNDVFNPDLIPAIYIDNTGDDISATVFYNSFEGYRAIYIKTTPEAVPLYLRLYSETVNNIAFIIYVPFAVMVNYNLEQIKAEVKKYAPFGRFFSIINY